MAGKQIGTAAVIVICLFLVLLLIIRSKAEWLLNICMRSILGMIAMFFINTMLADMGISLGVGINAFTVLTSGILGFPGIAALYGIGLYNFL